MGEFFLGIGNFNRGTAAVFCGKGRCVQATVSRFPTVLVVKGLATSEQPAAEAGRDDQGFASIESLLAKPRSQRTIGERAQVAMYSLMQSLGFFGILLCASVSHRLPFSMYSYAYFLMTTAL